MSLNLHLPEVKAVLRVHQPFEPRGRILELRQLRRRLGQAGLVVGTPLPIGGQEVVRWEGRWAELESYIESNRPAPIWESYLWMFGAMGRLHRALRGLEDLRLTRPTLATYGPPGTLRRWMAVTASAVTEDPDAQETATWAANLLRSLGRQWIPALRLPVQLVHGDMRLGNVRLTPTNEAAYLDFGFAYRRPRIHDIAYSLSWILLRPDASGSGADFEWERLSELIGAYEDEADSALSDLERLSLGPYLAAVPLYMAAISGYTEAPVAHLLKNRAFLRIADWVLAHPPS